MPLQPNQFVTSANGNTSLFITRQEVITALSTIASDLSGASTSGLFYNPNLQLSTLTMNAAGQINGFVPIQTSNVIFNSNTTIGQAGNLQVGAVASTPNQALCVTDNNGNTAPFRAENFWANSTGTNGWANGWGLSNTGLGVHLANYSTVRVATWNLGQANTICLSNISSINGAPVNANPTTYTNLSGNNITNNQVITTPSLVGVSSINGTAIGSFVNTQTWVPYTVTNVNPVTNTFLPNIPVGVLNFSNLPVTVGFNRSIGISVPIYIAPLTAPASDCRFTLIAWIGGQATGGSQVAQTVYLRAGSTQGTIVTLSGVCIGNGTANVLSVGGLLDTSLTNLGIILQQGSTTFQKFFFQQVQ